MVTAQLPHVPYLDSSPSNGMISGKPFIKRWGFASDDKFGDQHYYNYKADCLQWGSFPQTKFASEFGWQSYPSWHTYKAATAPKDWSVTGLMSNFRCVLGSWCHMQGGGGLQTWASQCSRGGIMVHLQAATHLSMQWLIVKPG